MEVTPPFSLLEGLEAIAQKSECSHGPQVILKWAAGCDVMAYLSRSLHCIDL